MANYIVCPNRRNAPRMNILVCRERCPMKEECPAFAACSEILLTEKSLPVPLEIEKIPAVAP